MRRISTLLSDEMKMTEWRATDTKIRKNETKSASRSPILGYSTEISQESKERSYKHFHTSGTNVTTLTKGSLVTFKSENFAERQ
jgi:hypothetical protein